ncbi:MAG: DUF4200 domain-containing protein [Planctomycetes bacterium]|nr:DUF4200 domain-containing protein [Planctomycetota bacterium]
MSPRGSNRAERITATLLLVAALAGPARPDDLDSVAGELLRRLEDDRWEVREDATRRLAALMPDVLPHLLLARDAGGEETRMRVQWILGPIRLDPDGRILQWAISARASSEYSAEGWSAIKATGEPDTPVAGDHPTAWASREADGGVETLELEFRHAVVPVRIRVHESFNPGAVVRIEAQAGENAPLVLWEGKDATAAPLGVLDVELAPAPGPVRKIRLVLDTRLVAGWNEIDAVDLVGGIAPASRDSTVSPVPAREEAVREAVEARRLEIERLRTEIERLEKEIHELVAGGGK